MLVIEGADLKAKDKYSLTPLHYAAFFGDIEVVKTLVVKGDAYVNAMADDGSTILHIAAASGCCGYLISSRTYFFALRGPALAVLR